MNNITQYSKAIVAIVTPIVINLILVLLAKAGVTADQSVTQAVTVLVTGFGVWFVPNTK